MIKNISYISKRILIGVGIGLLLMLIKGNLIGNVYAIDNNNTLNFVVPNGLTIENYNDKFYSNFASNIDTTNPLTMISPRATFNWYKRELNSPSIVNQHGDISGDISSGVFHLNSSSNGYYYSTDYIEVINNNFTGDIGGLNYTNFKLEHDTNYTILIALKKSDNLNFYSNADTIGLNLSTFKVNEGTSTSDYGNDIDYLNYINVNSLLWLSPNSIENGSSNFAYIKINFSLDPNAYASNCYLSRIGFSSNLSNQNYISSFVFNTSSSSGDIIIDSVSFIQDGDVVITGGDNELLGATPGMDTITDKDLQIFDTLNVCEKPSLWDISSLGDFLQCEFQNFTKLLKAQITRIGNFFSGLINAITNLFINLFIPDSSTLHIKLQHFFDLYDEQFGFLVYPFTLFNNIFNNFINLFTTIVNGNANYVITIPTLKEPFSNITIYSGGTLDLGYIFNYGAIGNLYEIYYMFIKVYIILLFINLCYDAFYSFVSGHGLTSSSTTTEQLQTFDYNDDGVVNTIHTTTKRRRY